MIYRYPTPMFLTKRNTKMSREPAIIENTCVSNYAFKINSPKMDILAIFRCSEVNLTRILCPSDIYKSIVFQVCIDNLYPFINLILEQ